MLVSHSIGLRVLLRVLFYDWLIASVIDSNFCGQLPRELFGYYFSFSLHCIIAS